MNQEALVIKARWCKSGGCAVKECALCVFQQHLDSQSRPSTLDYASLGNVEPDHLLAIHGADDLCGVHSCITIYSGSSMVLVKTAVYHAMGTLMPYPSEDPPRQARSLSC